MTTLLKPAPPRSQLESVFLTMYSVLGGHAKSRIGPWAPLHPSFQNVFPSCVFEDTSGVLVVVRWAGETITVAHGVLGLVTSGC